VTADLWALADRPAPPVIPGQAPLSDALPLRSISYGGGVQSTALLVLAAQGRIDFPLFLFCNVGDMSENPATLEYVKQYAEPYAARHGIELTTLRRTMVRSGETRDLYDEIMRPGSMAQKIPVRLSNGKPGSRSCTVDYKIQVVGRELARRGATAGKVCKTHRVAGEACEVDGMPYSCGTGPQPDCPDCIQPRLATVGIGISLDEIGRADGGKKRAPWERIEYPLPTLGLRRTDCERIILGAGLPIPPKSSCWFCPMHRPDAWHTLRRTQPEQFEKAC
jgi:hypothetical protein